ncbi:MAG: PorV/PorQ family protein [Candidatus Delongbacteria bacterium]|nr:PorV/PorQ family protein [Candidatus Delongbacteria bacterium]
MKNKICGLTLMMILLVSVVRAEVSKVGTTAAPFLNVEVGARAIGMGGAFVAMADDPSALFWNPGAIARLKGYQLMFNHDNYLADIAYNFIGGVFNLQNYGALGLSFTSLSMDEMMVTTHLYPYGTGTTFSAGSIAVGLCYGYNITDRFSIGGGFKYIKESIYNSSAGGMAFDIGTIFTTQFWGTQIGMSITNFGPKMKMTGTDLIVNYDYDSNDPFNNDKINADLRTDSYELPLMFRVGIATNLLQTMPQHSLWLAVDAMHPNDNSECVNVGMEYGLKDMFFMRGGYKAAFQTNSEQEWTAGGGIKVTIRGFRTSFDYAYQSFGRLENIQKMTLVVGY